MIESYSFGRIIIDGKEYLNDLIVFQNRIKAHWWRDEGHLLQPEDLEEVFATKPKVIIIGTGFSGVLKVDYKVKRYCMENDIKLIEEPTSKAVQEYNRLAGNDVVAAFHLTC
jgi:hypothetical protein